MASVLGGAVVVCMGVPSPRAMGHMLSFAAGIMMYISYADMLPHAANDLSTALGTVDDGHGHGSLEGSVEANKWFFVGMVAFLLIAAVVPDGDEGGEGGGHSHGGSGSHTHHEHEHVVPPSPVAALPPPPPPAPTPAPRASRSRSRRRSTAVEAPPPPTPAAVVAVVAPTPLVPLAGAAASDDGAAPAATKLTNATTRRLMTTAMIAALGISLHNLPEGLIVYNQTITGICATRPRAAGEVVSTPHPLLAAANTTMMAFGSAPLPVNFDVRDCLSRGVAVTFAIFLHNIPEGMAVASPVYASTGSAWQAMKYCLLSSMFEPLAAIIFGYFFHNSLTNYLLASLNAAVAGIMICLCFVELIPIAASHVGAKVRNTVTCGC